MSDDDSDVSAASEPAGGRVGSVAGRQVRRAAAAEWTKIRSVRSTLWTLILFVVLTVGLTAGLTALVVANWNGRARAAAERADHP